MIAKFSMLSALLIALFVSAPTDAPCQMLNPYLPHNAVVAQPPTPYYLRNIPRCSRTYYDPCPSCGPVAAQFPDLPPVNQPFPGPFGIPVPLP
jgi:hypothetical protein